MRYENPAPDQDINFSKEHPLKEFWQLLLGLAVVILIFVAVLNFTAGYLAKYVPFEYEQRMVGEFSLLDNGGSAQQAELQELADTLTEHMNLENDVSITVHFDKSDTVNAFATLGGHVLFYQGLLGKLESEQELAAVMAHEIAHIQHRHPIVAMGKGFTLAALAGFIGGATGSGAGEWLIGSSANLSLLRFSRQQETQADESAAAALFSYYGHIGGADELFKKFNRLESEKIDLQFSAELFRSHPHSSDRWQRLEELATIKGWPIAGLLSPVKISASKSD